MSMPESRTQIDGELAEALKAVPIGPNGAFDLTDIDATRDAVRSLAESIARTMPDEPSVTVRDIRVHRADGPDVLVRLLRPANAPGPLPAMLWFHGGGQVLGFAAQDEPWLKGLCKTLGCAVAAVDYRLAPETPAPGAAEDGYAAYQWISQNAADLGIARARIGLAGQSGGGGIAAAAALAAAGLRSGETVLVGGAAGGVGVFAVQLARLAGATVIGTASEGTFAFLRQLGTEPVAYGAGLADRVRAVAPGGVAAATDLFGTETALAALALGVAPERIAAIAAGPTPPCGVRPAGGFDAGPADLERITDAILGGKLTVPIAATFPVAQIREAVRLQAGRRVHGKVVVTL
jgi:NADPH:quinone reductase-like Zn-dependent oxidoreductase